MYLKHFITIIAIISFVHSNAQCKVQTTKRPDGTTVKYLRAELVGSGTGCELGLSIQSNGEIYTINTVVRYTSSTPKKMKGTLMVKLADNNAIEPKLYSTELATMNGEQIAVAVYPLSQKEAKLLKNSTITIVIFKEEGGKNQIVIVNKNNDVAKRHITCLENN